MPRLPCTLAIALILVATAASTADDDGAAEALARMPTPWKETIAPITAHQYDATLQYWAARHRQRLTLSERGRSDDGYPIWLLDLTDRATDDRQKPRVLVTALHSGPERSGTTTILHFIEWLLGDDPVAVEVLRKQRVLVMPIVNPHGFFPGDSNTNVQGLPVYDGRRGKMFDVAALKLHEPEKTPELRSFLGVVDEFQPEVHADIHGVTQQFAGQLVSESVGSAGSNHALRPWDWRISEAMIAAGREAGYPSDRFEADAQRMLWGPELEPHADKLWMGRVFFYPATYAYMKYHTLPVLTENGWAEGGAARLKGLLRAGLAAPGSSPYAGYPVDRVRALGGHFLAAYGTTAAERRKSRVELWNRQGSFSLGLLYPQCDCRAMLVCALSAAGRAAIRSTDPKQPMPSATTFVDSIRTVPGIQGAAIDAFVRAGPETKLYVEPAAIPNDARIEHGLSMVLRIPYDKAELVDVRLNGHRLPADARDGYQTWLADGFTHVQFNVPPEKARQADLLVASLAYRPAKPRSYGWRPPTEVLNQLQQSEQGPGKPTP